jgi:AcrR family transcriptional regulator
MQNKKDVRQNILDISAALIARKGFEGVGIREIAEKAKVNISMISYYFGSKVGILKAIIEEYFNLVGEILQDILDEKIPAEMELKKVIRCLVKLMSEKEDLCRVAILEMPLDVPEIAEYKLSLVKRNRKFIGEKLKTGFDISDKMIHITIGHAFISLVYSNFLLGKMINKTTGIVMDEKYYDRYSEIITMIFLNGINGIKSLCCPKKVITKKVEKKTSKGHKTADTKEKKNRI